MRDKIYKNILWFAMAGVLVFTPLVRGTVRLWSITPVEVVVSVLVFLWLWRINNRGCGKGKIAGVHKGRDETFRRTALDLPLWLFVGLAGASSLFSIYKYVSMLEMLRLMTMVGVFYLVLNNFGRRMSLRLVTLVIIMGTGMSVLGLGQYWGSLTHSWWIPNKFVASTYVNHNHFAGYLELAIPLAVGIAFGLKSEELSSRLQFLGFRFGLIAALIIMFVALVFSQSRGAWVSLAISLIVMNVVLIKRGVLKKESLVIFLFFLGLAISFIYLGYDDVAGRLDTIREISPVDFVSDGVTNGEVSLGVRAKIWRGSITMIEDNPLIGTGIGTFVWGFPGYRPEGLSTRTYYAHNDYLHMMAEMGILALPLMLWMLWVLVRAGLRWGDTTRSVNHKARNAKRKIDFGLMDGIVLGSTVGILSLAMHGLVDFNFHIPANTLVAVSLAGIIMRRST